MIDRTPDLVTQAMVPGKDKPTEIRIFYTKLNTDPVNVNYDSGTDIYELRGGKDCMPDAIYMLTGGKATLNPDYKDQVNHPSHYTTDDGIECIDAIRASMSEDDFAAYCKGNILKYVWRYKLKNGIQDLEKARVYLGWLLNTLKGEELTK